MLISRLIVCNATNMCQIIDDVMDTTLEQCETLDIGGWMSQIIWIHQTRTL